VVLPDVNVLVYAHREDVAEHKFYLAWLEAVVNGVEAFGLSELVLSGFLRVVTHPMVFRVPSSLKDAMTFTEQLRSQPNAVLIRPGVRHWEIFCRLCNQAGAKGNLIPDAFFAALAIEHGCEWITTDRDFSRFNGLRWRHPLQK
jgi:toxin-antitoxin system PIN domain toxin